MKLKYDLVILQDITHFPENVSNFLILWTLGGLGGFNSILMKIFFITSAVVFLTGALIVQLMFMKFQAVI